VGLDETQLADRLFRRAFQLKGEREGLKKSKEKGSQPIGLRSLLNLESLKMLGEEVE